MDQDRLVQAIFTLPAPPEPAPPEISNVRQTVETRNSNNCVDSNNEIFSGGEFTIVFDYNDPDGDASNSQGATVQAFGSFNATPFSSFTGDGFTGSVQSNLCFPFGNAPNTNVTVTLTDGSGLRSNGLTITIPAPKAIIIE
jgi:hypothetical protein